MSPENKKRIYIGRSIILSPEGRILFLQRAADDSWRAGEWEIPGGKYENNDEIFEETGLKVLHNMEHVYLQSGDLHLEKYSGMQYVGIISISFSYSEKVVLSPEHQGYKWVVPGAVRELNLSLETSQAFDYLGNKITFLLEARSAD